MISKAQAAATVRDFLADHPEHIQGMRQDLEHGTLLDTDSLIAFVEWTIRTGRGDTVKARAFREVLCEKFGK